MHRYRTRELRSGWRGARSRTWIGATVGRRLTALSALLLCALGGLSGLLMLSTPAAATPPVLGTFRIDGYRLRPSIEAATRERRWLRHEILPGENVRDVAKRYHVTADEIVRWNGLNARRPRLRAGQFLRVGARVVPPVRKRTIYKVRFGDTWDVISARYGIDRKELRKWNRRVPFRFRAGQRLQVWTSADRTGPNPGLPPAPPVALGSDQLLKPVASRGRSLGRPDRGRLRRGVRLPKNDVLYTRRQPDRAFGSSHTVRNLQRAVADWRNASSYRGALVVSDISRRRGGRLWPHQSHQSGRDVDIWLPLKEHLPQGTQARRASEVDWPATWGLIKALLDTGQVRYIFLDRRCQRRLYRAARATGISRERLREIVQYPRFAKTTVVRHAKGHDKHIHVRFVCDPANRRCR